MQPRDQLLPVTAPARILSLHLGKPLIMGTQESIFVSIACLDDPDVVLTVADIVAQARHPERIFVGVCLQIDPNDSSYQDLGKFKKCLRLAKHVVISHYPVNISKMNKPESPATISHVFRLRQIDETAINSYEALVRLSETPRGSQGISAAMLFITCETKKKIPFYLNLHFGLHAA